MATTPFGRRVAAIRQALGITQGKVIGISQSRVSKIEGGKETASANAIERLAELVGHSPIDLVRGTDREGYYFAQRLTPEEREQIAAQKRLNNVLALEYLYRFYVRVCELFDAVYPGTVVPAFRGEEAYIELVSRCKNAIAAVECFIPDLGDRIYFPDHFEPENADDDMLMCWDYFASELKKSLRCIQQARQNYGNADIEQPVIVELERYWRLDELDGKIAMLREARMSAERRLAVIAR